MKRLSLLLLSVVFTCSMFAQGVAVTVKNPAKLARQNVTVEVSSRNPIIKKQALRLEECIVRVEGSVDEIVSQAIDEDGDGSADVLVFQTDLGPAETKRFFVGIGVSLAKMESKTDARFVLPREDVAWENDRVAFRMYGPALAKDVNNGIDIWTKRVRYRIVEKWYKMSEGSAPGKDSYHVDKGEGADFFAVGRTLGAGAAAIWNGDSLRQPGVFAFQRVIATGPIRAQFELTYNPVLVKGKPLMEVLRITLDAGTNLNRLDATFYGEGKGPLNVMTGIVQRKGVVSQMSQKEGWCSLWGPVNENAENGELGSGIIVPKNALVSSWEDNVHDAFIAKTSVGTPLRYYSGASWSRMGDHKTADEWQTYLKEQVALLASPVTVTVTSR
jgi:unsaturated rhamnogalacturonyl hydrolase